MDQKSTAIGVLIGGAIGLIGIGVMHVLKMQQINEVVKERDTAKDIIKNLYKEKTDAEAALDSLRKTDSAS